MEKSIIGQLAAEIAQFAKVEKENIEFRAALEELLPKHLMDCIMIDAEGKVFADSEGFAVVDCQCPEHVKRIRNLIEK